MGKKKRLNVLKLSASLNSAAQPVSLQKLTLLRHMIKASKKIADQLAQIAKDLNRIPAPEQQPFVFTTALTVNEGLLREVFRDCDDVRFRSFEAGDKKALVVYLHGMADETLLEKNVFETLMGVSEGNQKKNITVESLRNRLITSAELQVRTEASEVIDDVMSGNSLLLVDGIAEALIVGNVKYVKRTVQETKTETLIRGPHDAFNETLDDNIVMVRRRARDANIKVKIIQVGMRSKTRLAIFYAANLVKPGLVEEVQLRLSRIKVDEIVLSAQVEEWIIDHPWSPFPQTVITERPESMLASLYEGRVGLIIDNTPNALIVPCTYSSLMQIPDDYAVQPVIASLIRFTRYITALAGTFLPAMYIAIVSYHPGMLPTTLAISVAELRAPTPYPAFMEVLIMEVILEIFQEAVTRLPDKLVAAASIVGGFVIGTTIVEAGIVNALLVVATAGTAIASYTMPNYNLSLALRWLRIPMVVLASILGFYGIMLGYLIVGVHMCSLHSFGESYLGGLFDLTLLGDIKDKLVRLPTKMLRARPKEFGSQDQTRIGDA